MISFKVEHGPHLPNEVLLELAGRLVLAVEQTACGVTIRVYPRTEGKLWDAPFETHVIDESEIAELERELREAKREAEENVEETRVAPVALARIRASLPAADTDDPDVTDPLEMTDATLLLLGCLVRTSVREEQGWDVFETGSGLYVQRDDEGRLPDDEAAIALARQAGLIVSEHGRWLVAKTVASLEAQSK